jgi:prepilin-type N-terminal cleavage/methylation domain-containing protein
VRQRAYNHPDRNNLAQAAEFGIVLAFVSGHRCRARQAFQPNMASFPVSHPPNPVSFMRRTRRSGFTLIELLIVVVIIGILASMAIPKFQATKGKASFAAMKSDLHNLTTAEEAYFYDHSQYSASLTAVNFTPSHGDALVIGEATATGWSATSSNPDSYPHFCALFIGTAAPVAPATAAGVVACQ